MTWRLGLLLLGLLAVTGTGRVGADPGAAGNPPLLTVAQLPRHPLPGPREEAVPPPPHRAGELPCRDCHEGKHQRVVRMYLGMGGRGTPMIPSHMFQVRVECVACHIVPKEAKRAGDLPEERTFEPGEQACLTCHGDRYRGMLDRWRSTLDRMEGVLAPKLAAARAALVAAEPGSQKAVRARKLLEDAEFNAEFVVVAKGVHNVFYAADLLKIANGWLDEALALLGKRAPAGDDALVRGGYCGVLCHEPAGVRLPETVTFARQKIPHARHTTEFGAVCTACHSADVHKAVTATPATCTGCHHSPQNERCESCHSAQSAFYRGRVKTDLASVTPNVMAEVVGCTGCHDLSVKHSVRAVGQKCLGCHDEGYRSFVAAWTTDLDKDAAAARAALKQAETVLARRRGPGQEGGEARRLLAEARAGLDLLRKSRGAHNPEAAQALIDGARQKAEAALGASGGAGGGGRK